MTDVEVHIDLEGQVRPLGILYQQVSRRGETVTFEYDAAWLEDANRFSIEPSSFSGSDLRKALNPQENLSRKASKTTLNSIFLS